MDIGDVMDQIASALSSISELNVHAYPVGDVTPPAAIVGYPEQVTFDETYGRGMDRMALPVIVAIGVPTEPQTRDLLVAYCSGSGASSVKAAIESASYSALHTVRVAGIDLEPRVFGGVVYMAAIFELDITGQGTA